LSDKRRQGQGIGHREDREWRVGRGQRAVWGVACPMLPPRAETPLPTRLWCLGVLSMSI